MSTPGLANEITGPHRVVVPRGGTLDAGSLIKLAALLGHRLAEGATRAYQAGVSQAAQQLGLTSEEVLRRALDGDAGAYRAVVSRVTIQETYFYRTPEHFNAAIAFAQERAGKGRPVRTAWSVGCATGEEAYSLAHALTPHASQLRVAGSDIAAEALRTARAGVYGNWSFRDRTPKVLGFTAVEAANGGEAWSVPQALRASTTFHEANLAQKPLLPPAELGTSADVIFCRNVLLYFAPPRAHDVLTALVDALADDGLLVLGALEVPAVIPSALQRVHGGDGCLFRKTQAARTVPSAPARSSRPDGGPPAATLERALELVRDGALRDALELASAVGGEAALDLCASLSLELGEPARARHFLRRLLGLRRDHVGAHLRLLLMAIRTSDSVTVAESSAALRRLTADLPAEAEIDGAGMQVAYVRAVLAELDPPALTLAEAAVTRRAQDLLKARAKELSRPLEVVKEAPTSLTLFRRGRQLFGVRLPEVSAGGLLKQLSPVPGAPPWVLGAVHHHGEVLTLLDLHALWGLSRAGVADLPTFIVLKHGGRRVGIPVEELLGVHDIEAVPTAYAGDERAGIHEIARHGDRAVLVISTARLLADPRL